jgi:hypothetical protein
VVPHPRDDLVARRILLPAEEDILMALNGEGRGSIDETTTTTDSPYTSHRADESEDDDAGTRTPTSSPAVPIDDVDDMAETDRDFLLRAASSAAAGRNKGYSSNTSSGAADVASPQPPAPSPSSTSGLTSGSSWLSSSQATRSKAAAPAHVPFTPAHHRNGPAGPAQPLQSQQSAAAAEPKRGLIQRFVSEKNVGSASINKVRSNPHGARHTTLIDFFLVCN